MRSRIELHTILVDLLGTKQVYYQKPSNVKMEYPAIVYDKSGENPIYADNNTYTRTAQYTVTVIDKDPDSIIADLIGLLPMCSFSRKFAFENLNHFVYTIYY